MIDEAALWLWARFLADKMGKNDATDIKRVLEYAYAFGSPIPEQFLIPALQGFFLTPPDERNCRHALFLLKLVPSSYRKRD